MASKLDIPYSDNGTSQLNATFRKNSLRGNMFNSSPTGHAFCCLLIFIKDQKNIFFKKIKNIFIVWNNLDPDQDQLLSSLIYVQTVSKGYQQTTLVGKELNFFCK